MPWIPMMPAIGNHDADSAKGANAYYNQIFVLAHVVSCRCRWRVQAT